MVMDETRVPRQREVFGAIVSTVLALQTPGFIMMRSYYHSELCNARILMWSEAMKALLSILPILSDFHLLLEKVYLAIVPVVAYSSMNLMSFWALQHMPASVAIVIVQLKLLWATIFARLFLARSMLNAKSFALVAICLGSIAITAYDRERDDVLAQCGTAGGEDEDGGTSVHAVDLVAVTVLVIETALSGFMSVYMQLIFEDGVTIMWRRNTQVAALSCVFFYVSEPYMAGNEGCPSTGLQPDLPGWLLAAANATGGILVALSILYSGAVGKTVATSAAIPLTVLSEALWIAHETPTTVQLVVSLSVMNGVLMFSVL